MGGECKDWVCRMPGCRRASRRVGTQGLVPEALSSLPRAEVAVWATSEEAYLEDESRARLL